MLFILFIFFPFLWQSHDFAGGAKFSSDIVSEISVLSAQGKNHLDYLNQKIAVPLYGDCWKNAISKLYIGCKFLTENVQNELALKFTDCFLQMAGYEPLNCEFSDSSCPKKLSDRAFNAYTEFYTHTQSICYYLENHVWQEETEKTVNRLASVSVLVAQQLEEIQDLQQNLLNTQKESLVLQQELIKKSKDVASVLKLSQDKMKKMVGEFQRTTSEQRKLLMDIFDNLISLKSWAIDEVSWFNSTVFFVTLVSVNYMLTSVVRTSAARVYNFSLFAANYVLERWISANAINSTKVTNNFQLSTESLNSLLWIIRKCSIFLSVLILIYVALTYHDYNLLNYKLLLQIKKQNVEIIKHFTAKNESNILSKRSLNSDIANRIKVINNNEMYSNLLCENNMQSKHRHSNFDELDSAAENSTKKLPVSRYSTRANNSAENKVTSESTTHWKLKENTYNLRSNKKLAS